MLTLAPRPEVINRADNDGEPLYVRRGLAARGGEGASL